MRFSTLITRTAPATAGKVTLGSDTLDPYNPNPTVTVVGGGTPSANDSKFGCVHVSRVTNINGFPLQRVAMGFVPPSGGGYPAGNITVTGWMFEEATQTWLQCPTNSDVPLAYTATPVPNQLTWFDPPALMDFAQGGANNGGNLQLFILIATSSLVALPAGDYRFPIGSDVSNPGM